MNMPLDIKATASLRFNDKDKAARKERWSVYDRTCLSKEMQMSTFPERKRPKILKKEKILQRTSPAVHITVAAQPISRGIIRKVT